VISEKEVGIVSWGVYIPWNRIRREDIAHAWQSVGSGEKAVASYDEDSLTMAVEAARNCLRERELREQVDTLYFCSTTAPYSEKQSAATIAEVLGLSRATLTVDIGNSIRAGTQGLLLALDAVRSGRAKVALVCAADKRLGMPGGSNEISFGDGGAALCIGKENVIATVEGSYSIREEIISSWRSSGDRYVRNFEERFGLEIGYNRTVPEAVKIALANQDLKPTDISKAVIYSANPRHLAPLAGIMGFDLKTQVQETLFAQVGNIGVAQVPMNVAAALEQVDPGQRMLVVNYSDGCDVLLMRITGEIQRNRKNGKTISEQLRNKRLISYLKYMRWKNIFPVEVPKRAPLEEPSASALWRDNKSLSLTGGKCKVCGTPQYPAFRVCIECGSKDQIDPYCFSDKVGKIVTFSHDNLATSGDPPTTVAVVDFNGGGRIICDVTDREPENIKVGMDVEMNLRILRDVGGICDYWWKCVPIR